MSAPIAIKADKRDALGTRANRRLRNTGLVPAVVYGHHKDVLPLQINKKEIAAHIRHGTHLFNLSIAGTSESVLIKDVQYDAFGNEVLHVDFTRVNLNERVTVNVSIELKGDPKGEKEGGVLQQILNELEIDCVVTEIPDVITIDVSHLGKDEQLHVSDVKLGGTIKILNDADLVICKVEEIAEEISDADEATAEPEVIGAKKDDEAAAEPAK
ncbi:MAG: 50S ribosomal protein L25 [Burkholderiales bacterium]|nr:50S ribosomal protein L25 [Phycisphaerae bacterium]